MRFKQIMPFRRLIVVALIVIVGFYAHVAPAGTVDPAAVYVHDGDTIMLNRQRMRIRGIDAPEISEPRCKDEQARGLRARDRLRTLVSQARVVEISDSGERDKYGRLLVDLFVDGKGAGRVLINEKLAVEWKPGREAWQERRRHWCGF